MAASLSLSSEAAEEERSRSMNMTGQLSYVDSLFLPLPKSPLRGAALGYTIDSYSESSSAIVDRTTPTRCAIDEEELFRDLFGSEAETRDGGFGGSLSPKSVKKSKPLALNKAIVWNSGATLTSPFGSTAPAVKSPRQAVMTASIATPSLSAPPPRQLATDLMTSRPPDTADKTECWDNRELSGVPEVDEDDDDDDDDPHQKMKPHQRGLVPLSPGMSFKKQNAGSIHHETLRFLEKLDLKTLLAQPRPDVKSFLPHGGTTIPTLNSNQVTYAVDGRVEDDDRSTRNWSTVPGAPGVAAAVGRKHSARKEPASNPLVANSSRLAHMELTYGTTAVEPRKARKQTLQRLANPISGHTSTLEALSPDQRRKREAETSEWVPPVASPPLRMLSEKKTRNLIERLSEAPNIYEAAIAASPVKSKRLIKGAKTLTPMVRLKSNQDDDAKAAAKSKPTKPSGSRSQASGRGMDERKAMLKLKLAARMEVSAPSAGAGLGATFLTQHEEDEAKLATRSSKLLAPRPPASRRLNEADGNHIPKRPTVPPSVRPRASSSSGAGPTPAARLGSFQRRTMASGVRAQPDDVISRSRQPRTASQPLSKAKASQSRPSNGRTPLKPSASTPCRTKKIAPTASSFGTAALLLGGVRSSDIPLKIPSKSSRRPGARVASQATSVGKHKSLSGKDTTGSVVTSQTPLKTSLPQIRKPAPNAPRRSPAPVTRRAYSMRDS